jgi:hypothetical protein
MIVRTVDGKANIRKMPIGLWCLYLSNESKENNFPTDYNWTPQMDNKIIALGPGTCKITPSRPWPRPANPGLWCAFCLHLAIFIVKFTPEFLEITFRLFVRSFPRDSRNTAITVIVATAICVMRVILNLTLQPTIDQRGSRPKGRSATAHIHDWTGNFSFWIKSWMSKYLFWHKII